MPGTPPHKVIKRPYPEDLGAASWQCIIQLSPSKGAPTRQEVADHLAVSSADWSAGSSDLLIAPVAPDCPGAWLIQDLSWGERRRGRTSRVSSPSKRPRLDAPTLSLHTTPKTPNTSSTQTAASLSIAASTSIAIPTDNQPASSEVNPSSSSSDPAPPSSIAEARQLVAAATAAAEASAKSAASMEKENKDMRQELEAVNQRVESLEEWRFDIQYGNCWSGLRRTLQKMFETQVLDYISDNFTSLKTEGYLSMNPNQYPKHIKMRADKYATKVVELRQKTSGLSTAETAILEIWSVVTAKGLARTPVDLLQSLSSIIENAGKRRDEAAHATTTKQEFDTWIRPAIVRSGILHEQGVDELWMSLKEVKVDVVGRAEKQVIFKD